MHFPVSGVDAPIWLPPVVAFCISFVTSMGGVSGAFLLMPFQVSVLGYCTPSVSATNHLFNIVAIPSGVYRFIREKRMVWPLAWVVVGGTLPAVFAGAWIRVYYLPDPNNFKLFIGIVLVYMGLRLLIDALKKEKKSILSADHSGEVKMLRCSFGEAEFEFSGNSYSFSPSIVFILCFVVGIVGGIYGIGGGSIVAPFLISIMKLPVYTVAGAALLGTFITSIAGVLSFQILAFLHPEMSISPDWLLGIMFGVGGFFGIYLGARLQKHIPARVIKYILCASILFISIKYIAGYF